MDFKQAKLDGYDVLRDSSSGIYYTQKEWRTLTTEDSSQNLAGYHGRTTSITYARKRVITLEGIVDRIGNSLESVAVQYLQNLFNLQSDTTSLTPRLLYVMDMYDDEWMLNVKVKDPIRFIEYDDSFRGAAWKWQVVLESVDDPSYKSFQEKNVPGIEGTFGGTILGETLPLKMDHVINYIQCTTVGNSATPARIEMLATGSINSPLMVNNLTDGTFFGLSVDATDGDSIIIDSDAQTVEKNGVSIKALRIPGSTFPMISGTTKFSIEDMDGGIPSNDISINVYFRDSILA